MLNRLTAAAWIATAVVMGAAPERSLAQDTPPAQANKKSVDLRPKFRKGQDVRFKMTMRSSGLAEISPLAGQEGGVGDGEQEMVIRLSPKEVNAETGTTLDLVYESLKVKMGEIEFDSSKPVAPDDPSDGILRSIVGLTLKVTMDKDGNISGVTGGGDGDGISAMLMQQFTGADVIKGLFGPVSTMKKTAGRASVGESWTTNDSLGGMLGTMRLSMTHTLESATGGKAIIKTKGRVVLDGSEGSALGISIKDSVISGNTEWDIEAGMLTRMTQDNKIVVQTNDENGKPSSQNHSMKVDVVRLK
jgi:hypothetical protein